MFSSLHFNRCNNNVIGHKSDGKYEKYSRKSTPIRGIFYPKELANLIFERTSFYLRGFYKNI